ncbi:MAG: 50S ribosomal protein L10 [Coxiellaceae bacterium]|jgi:large subunit ribosomal protein L10|nr:50S ribosomal protein L10 [Coxiellaceae bacterium]
MVLRIENKKTIVSEVASIAAEATSAVIVDYRGLTVAEMTDLRAKARKLGVYIRVVRNTLAGRAMENTSFACMREFLKGTVFLAFSLNDPGSAARLLKDAIRDYESLVVRALSIDGKLLHAQYLDTIAKLPTHKEALAMTVLVLKAPITKLVRTITEPYAMLVRAVATIRSKRAA